MKLISDKKICKGLVYRLSINQFINKRGQIIYKETMTPLKRESCPGCEQCYVLRDDLAEWFELMDNNFLIDELMHGAKYKLSMENIVREDDGIIDDYDLIFKRL